MASADGNPGSGSGGQRHTIRIPIPRNLPPGQRYTIRLNLPPGAANPGAPHRVQLVNIPADQLQGQGAGGVPHPIFQQLQQQQREEQLREIREREERAKIESDRRKEKLKEILGYEEAMQVEFDVDALTATLSWESKDVEVPEGVDDVEYAVLAYCDNKPDSKGVYSGTDNTCVLGGEVLTLGHTHHFTVNARVGDIKGDPSPKASVNVPARPPSKPLPPKLSNRTKTMLTFRWNAPSDNGSPILHYEFEWDQCRGEWDQLVCDKVKQFKFATQMVPYPSSAEFRVRATNSVGTSPFSDPLPFKAGAKAPSVPQPPTIVQVGVKHLELRWIPPQSNGADITSYALEMEDPKSGYGYRPVYQGPDTSFTCTGLRRVTGYNFRLTATNEKGQSQASPSVIYHTLSNVPSCPPPPRIRGVPHPNSLNITWEEPSDDGGLPVQTYVLQMSAEAASDSGETMESVYTGPERTYMAEGLKPGRKYHARVCAVSAAGRGDFSPPGVLSTPAVRPSPPLYVYVTGKPTQTTIPIQWGYPLSDGGSPIISYGVEMSRDLSTDCGVEMSRGLSTEWNTVATVADPRTFDGASSSTPVSPPPLSHTVTHLSPGQQYVFRVTCRNSVGASEPSTECNGLTGPGQPDCPSQVESSDISANSALLKWKIPDTHGCPVETYSLQWFAELKSDQVSSSSAITNQTCLQGLAPATSFQARVKALSSAGPSDWSLPVTFTTAPSTPSPPTFTKLISSTPTSLLIAWDIPRTNGSPVAAYHIEVGVDSGQVIGPVIRVDASETQHTISNLKPRMTYRYRVQAENAIGRGLFGSYGSGTTLPPPPPPPHLTLSSCSSHMLKVSWGKKPNRNITSILHMASNGSQFHEIFRGNAVTHRITRLQPDTEYILRVAASSASGQGEWSDDITFVTTPTPPTPPADLVLKQASNEMLQLSWKPVGSTHPVIYEVQYRTANVNQDYQQCYKGPSHSTLLPLPTSSAFSPTLSTVYEARVRSCATCTVNGREEQLWSGYSPGAFCKWEKKTELPSAPVEGDKKQESPGLSMSMLNSGGIAVLIFVVVTLITIVVALLLGNVAV